MSSVKSMLLSQNLNTVIARFEYGDIKGTSAFLKHSKWRDFVLALEAKTSPAVNSEKRLVFVESREEIPALFKQGERYFLTKKELLELLSAPDEKFAEMPQLWNTLENAYPAITVVGDSAYADACYAYFAENPKLKVQRLSADSLILEDGIYRLPFPAEEEEVFLFLDLFAEYSAKDINGKPVLTVFAKRIYRTSIKTIENMYDVDEHIIPKLVANGVSVIKLYVPDTDRIEHSARIKCYGMHWRILRHFFPSAFERKRNRRENKEYLAEEVRKLTNDNSKGYSEMHGNGRYMNFDHGFRRTVGNDFYAKSNIYIFGPCFIRGLSREDADTLPSMIQADLGREYRVHNYGSEFQTCCYIMRSIEYQEGDIVILFSPELYRKRRGGNPDITEIDLTVFFNKIPHVERHVFDILLHFDMEVQNQIVSQLLPYISKVKGKCGERNVAFGPETKRAPGLIFCKDEAFKLWLKDIAGKNPVVQGQTRGAIIMNCNPFTNGHRYLIETSAKKVDRLFVFVVQENKSVFPFEDRLELVKKGTQDISNLVVLPSGNYMISSSTLPGYFEKEQLSDCCLDASTDLLLFVQIAAKLGISVRFAGEEPFDRFTGMYNDNMKAILPRYGIRFEVIERKTEGGKAVSASLVRALLKEQKWDEIKKLVPDSTYSYLQENYK